MGEDTKMEMITIPLEEYKVLLENVVRIKSFERYVNSEEYSISREMCGIFLDFEVKKYDAAD